MERIQNKVAEKAKGEIKKEGKVSFADDILEIPLRKVDFECHGFKYYKIQPQLVSVPSRYSGFDVYVCGNFLREKKSPTEFFVRYKELVPNEYQRIKMYLLSDSNLFECSCLLGIFENAYLKKQCQFIITK